MNVLFLISALLTSPEIPAENRLSSSASPYLRQHASNPVDWYPWGDEAIARARRENRPIFLSIGYSTCHWCHVMERESFSNPEVAAVLNEHFISIKVDREEWPDIDSTYLAWLSTTNGDTGWPANLLLTPDLIPFWGGTYFPPRSRDGRPGLIEIAERLGSAWRENPASIAATAKQMRDLVGSVAHSSDAASLARMREVLLNRTLASFDEENGGFSSAPKFPQPSRLLFLLGHANDHDAAANAVRVTLEQIEAGAIHDQVGGGFHRYATDVRWRVPHFEKMLYDQAQLALVFAEASVVLRRPDFLATAVDTLEFVERELRLPGGLWAGALGAESGDAAGVVSEGAYYVWSDADLEEAIADRRALRLVRSLYRVNAAEKPLSRATDLAAAAQKLQMDVDTARDLHHQALERLAETRNERPRPFRDEKVITAWNAMAIASFARVGTLADDEHLVEIASSAATRLLELARTREHGLVRSMVNGKGEIPAVADDYSWLIRALLDLFDATGERRWLEAALELDREFRARLGTSNEEYRRSSQSLPLDLIVGPDDGDSAEPWWASVQIENLARLAAITADPEREKQARDLAAAWMPRISRNPQNWPYMIEAIGLTGGRSRQIVISGVDEDESAAAMVETALKRWRRGEVILRVSGSEDPIVRLLPHLQYMKPIAGAATAYVCENYTCRQPAKTVQQLRSQLSENTIPGEVE